MTVAGIAVYAGLYIGYRKMTKKSFRETDRRPGTDQSAG